MYSVLPTALTLDTFFESGITQSSRPGRRTSIGSQSRNSSRLVPIESFLDDRQSSTYRRRSSIGSQASRRSSIGSQSSGGSSANTSNNPSFLGLRRRKKKSSSSTTTTEKFVCFDDNPVVSTTSMDRDEMERYKSEIWYSRAEILNIKESNEEIVDLKRSGDFKESSTNTFLGLEYYLRKREIVMRREMVYGTVLSEQRRQLSKRPIANPEKLARCYRKIIIRAETLVVI